METGNARESMPAVKPGRALACDWPVGGIGAGGRPWTRCGGAGGAGQAESWVAPRPRKSVQRRRVVLDTDISLDDRMPPIVPWTIDQVLDSDYWPD